MNGLIELLLVRAKAVFSYFVGWILRIFLPVNSKKYLFMSMSGNNYGDSVKNISDYITQNEPHAEIIWAFSKFYYDKVDCQCKKVKLYSIEYYYHVVTAKYIVTNFICNEMMLLKRKKQVKLQTWHGTALKKIGHDSESPDHSKLELMIRPDIYKREERNTDILISGSKFMTEVYHRALEYHKEIYETGMPRNDIFFCKNEMIINKVHLDLGICEHTKIILYAPTFRPDGNFLYYDVDLNTIKSYFEKLKGEDYVVAVRLHPALLKKTSAISDYFPKGIINATLYPDMQELLYATDVLITDYSSSMFDFMLSYKPIILYTPDRDTYKRGFYFDIDSLPFIKVANNRELKDKLDEFSEEKYRTNVDIFMKAIGLVEDGNATERVVELLKNIN